MRALGVKAPQFTPSPFNLFMNIPVHEDRVTLSFEPPTSKAGEYISLKAEMDLVVAFSACPQVSLALALSLSFWTKEELRDRSGKGNDW
jgi:uncharacterized protein YcgI (DUF1989 family)